MHTTLHKAGPTCSGVDVGSRPPSKAALGGEQPLPTANPTGSHTAEGAGGDARGRQHVGRPGRAVHRAEPAEPEGAAREAVTLTRFSMELWNSLIFFKVSLSRLTSFMYMARSWQTAREGSLSWGPDRGTLNLSRARGEGQLCSWPAKHHTAASCPRGGQQANLPAPPACHTLLFREWKDRAVCQPRAARQAWASPPSPPWDPHKQPPPPR